MITFKRKYALRIIKVFEAHSAYAVLGILDTDHTVLVIIKTDGPISLWELNNMNLKRYNENTWSRVIIGRVQHHKDPAMMTAAAVDLTEYYDVLARGGNLGQAITGFHFEEIEEDATKVKILTNFAEWELYMYHRDLNEALDEEATGSFDAVIDLNY